MTDQRHPIGTRLGELAMAAGAVLASLLTAELGLRLFGVGYPIFVQTDSIRGAAHIPGAKGWYSGEGHSWVEINSDGFRGPEVAVKKPAGTFRIALLGDSFIEAVQVPFGRTVGEVLKRRLATQQHRPVEVLNFGEGGYGSTQELLTLQHEVWKYSPDLVLLAVTTGNDISDNYRPLKRVEYVPYHVFRGPDLVVDTSFLRSKEYLRRHTWVSRMMQRLMQHSRLAQLVNEARYRWRVGQRHRERTDENQDEVGFSENVYLPPRPHSDWDEAWKITEGVLRLMRDECRSNQTRFAIITLSNGIQVTPVVGDREKLLHRLGIPDLYYPERRLADFGKREGIPVLNLAPAMANQAQERQVFFHGFDGNLGKGHWNERGHEFAGELVAQWIARGFTTPK